MSEETKDAFVPVRDEQGNVRGIMDRGTADYLASRAPAPSQASLDALLASVTRVRVLPFSSLCKDEEQVVLLDTSDPASLAAFRDCFAVVEDPSTFGHCMCCGNPHIELYAGDERAATLGYHHGASLRWNAWRSDVFLREPDRLLDWMSAHGVPGPRREVEDAKRRAEESARNAKRWLAATPECLRPFWGDRDRTLDRELHRRMLEALRAAFVTEESQALALFGWFGSGAGPWSGYPAYESAAEQLLFHYATPLLIQALTTSSPSDAQWLGAARYFGNWGFYQTKKGETALLPDGLKQRLLEVARSTGIKDNAERAKEFLGV
jgi:hypothetical protein